MKRIVVVYSLAVIGAIAFASMPAITAAEATGTVKGSVTHSGNPVAGAKVTIASVSDSSYGAVAYTDAQGAFSFSAAPIGVVELRVFDGNDQLLVTGKGELQFQDEVITLKLEIAP